MRRLFLFMALCGSMLALLPVALAPPRPAAAAPTITEYPIPTANSQPDSIAAGSDGALWFTEFDANRIGRITVGGVITEYPIPTADSGPMGIAAGSDGALWFTELGGNKIGRITVGGVITEYPIPTVNGYPKAIVAGPDGALWFTTNRTIGRITVGGAINEFTVPTTGSYPDGIAVGPDGALWFAEVGGNKIGRITVGGVITEYPLPTADSQPTGIVAGPDGALWFTEFFDSRIVRITTDGVITEFTAPNRYFTPHGIAVGPDGALWFTTNGQIGRITTGGAITFTFTPTANGRALGIAAGPDGALWFTEFSANRIGRLIPDQPPGPSPSASPSPPGAVPSFADVPTGYWAHDQIGTLAARGITTGCDTDLYCPERGVTRAEMAVFLDRTLGYRTPPAPASPTFADVPPDYWAYAFIDQFAKLAITTGCDPGEFCPDRGVTRAEMAAFLIRARKGDRLAPATPTFADVPPSHPQFGYVEALVSLGVTTGCGTDEQGRPLYCPDRGVTRAEMAVFIIRAFP